METTSNSSASTKTTANTTTTTPADRKRLTDRKAQRQRRERIKTYIARLEKTLEELTSSGNGNGGVEATLLKQLEAQREKTERLSGAISTIQGVLEESRESTAFAGDGGSSVGVSLGQGSGTRTGTGTRPSISRNRSARGNGNGNAYQSQASQQRPSESAPSPPPPPSTSQPEPPFTIMPDLAKRISLHTQNPRNSGTRNYVEIVNESISTVSGEQDCLVPSSTDGDDDIAIRAILFGWGSIHDKYGDVHKEGGGKGGGKAGGKRLDRVWGLLQALDQGIFSQTGLVERVAVLRLMRAMIKWNLSPRKHTIPSFMFPTVTQSMIPHAPIIDFFAWPNLRDHLIVSNINNITETSAALYISQIRLNWPYELRDICRYNVSENRYTFSAEFDSVYYDLTAWTINAPGLQGLIEAGPVVDLNGFDTGLGGINGLNGLDVGLGHGSGNGHEEDSYWDRLLDGCDQM